MRIDSGARLMLRSSDIEFVMNEKQANVAKLELGKLALRRASAPEVKAFAETLVSDQEPVADQLKALAETKHMTLADVMDSDSNAEKLKLERLNGLAFDQAYSAAALKQCKNTVKRTRKEVKSGKDPAIVKFARQMLPTAEQRLQQIQPIHAQLAHQKAK